MAADETKGLLTEGERAALLCAVRGLPPNATDRDIELAATTFEGLYRPIEDYIEKLDPATGDEEAAAVAGIILWADE